MRQIEERLIKEVLKYTEFYDSFCKPLKTYDMMEDVMLDASLWPAATACQRLPKAQTQRGIASLLL